MAKRKARRRTSSRTGSHSEHSDNGPLDEGGLEGPGGPDSGGETTGNMIITTIGDGKTALDDAVKRVSSLTGISCTSGNVCSTADFGDDEGISPDAMEGAGFVRLENLNIAIVRGDPGAAQMATAATAQDDGVVVEPEFWNFTLGMETTVEVLDELSEEMDDETLGGGVAAMSTIGRSRDFLLGCRSVIDMLLSDPSGSTAGGGGAGIASHRCFRDTQQFTWGLQATDVRRSSLSGRGVRVSVLDTGFDISHPDFAGRTVRRQSFIPSSEPDNSPDDRNGHGTHCIGTSCGPRIPGIGPRYGIAFEAEIFAGKVLRQGANGRAAGADGWILAGIDWALRNNCQVISMSLGSLATSSQFPQSYERAARTGLRRGTLIVAATGNDSVRRRGLIAAVGRPANCPSIASVAAADSCFRIADFSNGQRFANGGEVNLTGPGVAVLSSVPMPGRRAVFDGTSMATPHVAGIAALVHQQTQLTGVQLYRELRRRGLNLGISRDFGHGLCRV